MAKSSKQKKLKIPKTPKGLMSAKSQDF